MMMPSIVLGCRVVEIPFLTEILLAIIVGCSWFVIACFIVLKLLFCGCFVASFVFAIRVMPRNSSGI